MIPSLIIGAISIPMTMILILGSFVTGSVIAYFFWGKALIKKNQRIIKEAESEAEVIKRDKILQAKEKFLQLRTDHEKYIIEKNKQLGILESKLKQKETILSQRMEETERKSREIEVIRENLNVQMNLVEKKNEELKGQHKQHVEQLEIISGMSGEEAKKQLIESLKEEAKRRPCLILMK